MDKFAANVFGGPGAGKTAFIVSSFWDWKARKQIRNGRLVVFGQEERDNSLDIPKELIVRFASPITEPLKAIDQMDKWLRKVNSLAAANSPERLEVIAFDGYSEWNDDVLHEHREKNPTDRDKWAKFDYAKEELQSILRLMDPLDLNAYILSTARVTRRRKAIKDKKGDTLVEADPEWMDDWDYFPAMSGWARDNIGHKQEFVLYMEAGELMTPPKGKPYVPHLLHMVPTGKFWIKHKRLDLWLEAGQPNYLTNSTFDDMLSRLEKVREVKSAN